MTISGGVVKTIRNHGGKVFFSEGTVIAFSPQSGVGPLKDV